MDRRHFAVEHDLGEGLIGREIEKVAREAAQLLADLDEDRQRGIPRAHRREVVEREHRLFKGVDAANVRDRRDEATIWPSSIPYSRCSARVCATSSYGAESDKATASAIIRFCWFLRVRVAITCASSW